MQQLAWGPFILDSEFHSMIGVERSELVRIVNAWPNALVVTSLEPDPVELQEGTVHYVLQNLIEFPHRNPNRLRQELALDREGLLALIHRWDATRM
jgi:hypothetical protein